MRPGKSLVSAVMSSAMLLLNLSACIDEGRFPPPAINFLAPAPSWVGVPYEDVLTFNAIGQPVRGWWMPATNATATILINHGAVSNRSSLTSYYIYFHNLGYNVLVYDYQGFGDSYSSPSLSTILVDATAAIEFIEARAEPGADTIVIYGISLGTLPTFALAAADRPSVAGIIIEGSFQPQALPSWSLLLVGIVPWASAIDHMPPDLDPMENVVSVDVPKLFLQSREDVITPFESAAALYDLALDPKQFAEVIGPHATAAFSDPRFGEIVGDWLQRVVPTLDGGE